MDSTTPQYKQFDLDNNIGFLIGDAHRMLTASLDKLMSPLGLTRSQVRVILFLSRQNGCTQVELADSLEIGKVAMGALLDRLADKQLIVRKEHPQDRRAKKVYLTKNVLSLYVPMSKIGDGFMERLLDGINEKQKDQLVKNLKP